MIGHREEESGVRRPSLMDKGMFTEKIYVARSGGEGGGGGVRDEEHPFTITMGQKRKEGKEESAMKK